MRYTPQQMMGGSLFGRGVRLGNWQEDVALAQARSAETARAAASGSLPAQKMRAKIALHTRPAVLTPLHPDGHLRFGDVVMLHSVGSGGFLAVDLDDVIAPPPDLRCHVTTAPFAAPVLRAAWVIDRAPATAASRAEDAASGIEGSEKVHFGQRLLLRLHPDCRAGDVPPVAPLYLRSVPASAAAFSPTSRRQEVSVSDTGGVDLHWRLEYCDPSARDDMVGQPVAAAHAVLLRHCGTTQLVGSSGVARGNTHLNDFGGEREVFCGRVAATRTKHKREAEEPDNTWAIIPAPDPAAASAAAAADAGEGK